MARHWLRLFVVFASVGILADASLAFAQVDEALVRIDDADWDGALQAFARAEAGDDLSLDDLATLYANRAAVYFALGDDRSGRLDLSRLAAIRPDYTFDATAPPTVRAAFDDERGSARPLTLRAEADVRDGARTRIRVRVRNDPEGLVLDLRLSYRTAPSQPWTVALGEEQELPGTSYEYFAEAIGPGGAVVATDGTATEPHRTSVGVDLSASPPPAASDDTMWWAIGGTAIGVVVVGAIVIAVAVSVSTPSDQTAFGPPMLRMP